MVADIMTKATPGRLYIERSLKLGNKTGAEPTGKS